MPEPFVLKFSWDSHVVVTNTHGASDHKFSAQPVDAVGLGGGDTPVEAVLSLCESLRAVADEIEANVVRQKGFGDE